MKKLIPMMLLVFLTSLGVHATSVLPRSLADLVKESDHVFIATVVKVDMVNSNGEEVKDKKAMTGPGLENEIRFHLDVKEVIFTKSDKSPKKVLVPLWQAWHYQLGEIQDTVTGNTSIFLLKGNNYNPVYPADFQRYIGEKKEIISLIQKYHAAH
jgi:hypothetical protein